MMRNLWPMPMFLLLGGVISTKVVHGTPPQGEGDAKIWVALREKSMVSAKIVRLGDIAAINGGTPSQRQHLAQLDLLELHGARPAAVVPKDLVFYRLRLAGLDADQFQLIGSVQTRLELSREIPPPGPSLKTDEDKTLGKEEPPVVKSRDPVRLTVRVGGLRITALGEALQDGRVGQNIRVRNVDSNKMVTGRVLDRGLVEVDY